MAAIRRNIKNVTNGKVKVKVKKKEVRNSVRQAVLKEKVANGTATKLEKMQVLEHWEDSPELAEKKAVVEGGDGWKAHWGDVFEWPQTKELEES